MSLRDRSLSRGVGDELLAGLQLKGAGDRSFEEPNHVGSKLVNVVEEDVMARVLQLEDLRAPTAEVLIVLDNGVRALRRAEKVARSVDESNGEIEVLQHAVGSEERLMREAEVAKALLRDKILLAPSLRH